MTHSPLPVLTTGRLVMTPVALTDFDDLKRVWADPVFVAAITGRPLSEEEVWFRLLRDIGHWSALGHGNWSLRTADGGAYVGSVGVLDYRRDLTPPFTAPDLGWGAATPVQGQGLAAEGLRAALDWVDGTLGAPRTVCMISPDNHPSIRLAEKVGYRTYGDGTYKDHTVRLFARPRA